jgi:hypothetical protein
LEGRVTPIMRRGAPPRKWPRLEMHGESSAFAGLLSLPILESMPEFFEIIFTAQ